MTVSLTLRQRLLATDLDSGMLCTTVRKMHDIITDNLGRL